MTNEDQMIQQFVTAFDAKRADLLAKFQQRHPASYTEIVRNVIEAVTPADDYGGPDPERIHLIDDGDYQGTLLFVIAAKGYQPSDYWYVRVGYGSCSGCDTLQAICDYSSDLPTREQTKEYLTLALHIVQGLKELS